MKLLSRDINAFGGRYPIWYVLRQIWQDIAFRAKQTWLIWDVFNIPMKFIRTAKFAYYIWKANYKDRAEG